MSLFNGPFTAYKQGVTLRVMGGFIYYTLSFFTIYGGSKGSTTVTIKRAVSFHLVHESNQMQPCIFWPVHGSSESRDKATWILINNNIAMQIRSRGLVFSIFNKIWLFIPEIIIKTDLLIRH